MKTSCFSVFLVALALGVTSFVPGAYSSPDKAAQGASDRFAAMDADKDGRVSKEEFFASHPQMREAAFAAIDRDNDGSISAEEWNAFATGHSSGMSGQAGAQMKEGTMPMGMPKEMPVEMRDMMESMGVKIPAAMPSSEAAASTPEGQGTAPGAAEGAASGAAPGTAEGAAPAASAAEKSGAPAIIMPKSPAAK